MSLKANGKLIIILDNMKLNICNKPFLSEKEFYHLMERVNLLFTPPISDAVDLRVYSHKLYTHASFIICKESNNIIGFTAFYKNKEEKQLYVSLICVESSCQSLGVGGKMLAMLSSLKTEGFYSIGLEVVKTNKGAYNFYKKHGFIEHEDRGKKILMHKML